MSEPAKTQHVTITVQMTTKHDIRAVRRLLKNLLRGYGLKCVRLEQAPIDASLVRTDSTETHSEVSP